jgi:hypothetical protein
MRLPFTRRLPSSVRESLGGERPLAFGTTPPQDGPPAGAAGGYVVATLTALHLPDGVRLPWERIDQVQWEEEGMRIREVDGTAREVPLAERGRLPEAVSERVTATIVVNRHVRLHDGKGVRLVARRAPGSDSFTWQRVFDPGLDAADPGLQALADQALEDVRRSLGV